MIHFCSSTGTDVEQVKLARYSLKLSRCWNVYKWHTKESFRAELAGVSSVICLHNFKSLIPTFHGTSPKNQKLNIDFLLLLPCLRLESIREYICRWRRSWLRHCATSRQVTTLLPNGVLGFFNYLTLRSLTLYIYGAPILDVSRSHTTTQHSR